LEVQGSEVRGFGGFQGCSFFVPCVFSWHVKFRTDVTQINRTDVTQILQLFDNQYSVYYLCE